MTTTPEPDDLLAAMRKAVEGVTPEPGNVQRKWNGESEIIPHPPPWRDVR